MSKKHTLYLFLILLFPFCKTTKNTDAPKPMEQYNNLNKNAPISTLNIPLNIGINELVQNLNTKITGVLYEDYSFDDNGKDDLMLKIMKSQDITLFMTDQTLKYRVPVSLWMKKKLLVGSVEGQGEIALNFKTNFSLKENWTLPTYTEVEFHEWIKKPVLKTGIGDLGIESIANIVLNRSKQDLAKSIDKVVGEQLNLRPIMQSAWEAIQSPTLLSPEYQMWLKTTPISISMTSLTTTGNAIKSTIAVECYNDVSFGEKPAFRENSNLPDLKIINESADDFKLHFTTDVPFAEAEKMAKNSLIGQLIGEGKQQVRVEDIKLTGNDDKIVVNTQLSGAFNGKIYFIGKPVFNEKKNQIEFADLDYHIDTKSFLHRSASWLLKGILKNRMQKAMVFPLEENITALKKSVQTTLDRYEIQPGVVLTGKLNDVKVLGTSVSPTSILVNLSSEGKVNVSMNGL
jgi:Domain of unknown function (DUF4403)